MALSSKKLCFFKDSVTYEINLYDNPADIENDFLSIQSSEGVLYAALGDVASVDASFIRVQTTLGTKAVLIQATPALTTINDSSIPITRPATGNIPQTSITDTQFSGSIVWSPPHSPFNPGENYTANMQLIPATNYTLDGVPVNFFIASGAISTTNNSNSGAVTAVYPTTSFWTKLNTSNDFSVGSIYDINKSPSGTKLYCTGTNFLWNGMSRGRCVYYDSVAGQWNSMSCPSYGGGKAVVSDTENNGYFADDNGDIYRWTNNGSSWTKILTGVYNTNVLAIHPNTGDLYIGKSSNSSVSKPGEALDTAYPIIKWDGSNWTNLITQPLGNGYSVNDIKFDSTGNLVVVGYFSGFDGVDAKSIIKYDGSNWTNAYLANGYSTPTISAVELISNNIFIAGTWSDDPAGNYNPNFAKWNGTTWQNVGNPNGQVYDIIQYNGNIYITGTIDRLDNVVKYAVMKYNGSSWESMSAEMGSYSTDRRLAIIGSDIIVAGTFSLISGTAAPSIAKRTL